MAGSSGGVDVQKMIEFLHLRPGKDGQPVSTRLGKPEPKVDGWYRLAWLDFDFLLPCKSLAEGNCSAEWKRAWHGCPMEAVYSILHHGGLKESCDEDKGDRFFQGAPGVYVHGDHLAHKAENYTRFTPVFGDGTLWCVKLELMVDRTDKVDKSSFKSDQWIQRSLNKKKK